MVKNEFNVIVYDINSKKFIPYNVIPYLVNCYNKKEDKPTTTDDFKEFIKSESLYRWWARCEYEVILRDWPSEISWKKIDVYEQVMMNLEVVTEILIAEIIGQEISEKV